jgi:hypothetical protein
MFCDTFLKFFLQVSTSVLIFAQGRDLSLKIFNTSVHNSGITGIATTASFKAMIVMSAPLAIP